MDESPELTDVESEELGRAEEATAGATPTDADGPADEYPAPRPPDADGVGDEFAAPLDAEQGVADEAATETAPQEAPELEITAESVVEALLFASDAPLPATKVAQLVGVGDARDVKKHVAALNERYERNGRAFRIEAIAKGYQMLTLPAYNAWVHKLLKVRDESKLSAAAMETLAIVAYKQPVLRADVEAIRGVACGEMLNKLREMNLVKIVGRAEEPGRPMLYGTTNRFLEVFGLSSLEDLPGIESLPAPVERQATPPPGD